MNDLLNWLRQQLPLIHDEARTADQWNRYIAIVAARQRYERAADGRSPLTPALSATEYAVRRVVAENCSNRPGYDESWRP